MKQTRILQALLQGRQTRPGWIARWRALAMWTVLFAAAPVLAQPPAWQAHGRLGVSPNRRYIQHADGTPFFWLGDTAWALFWKLNREDVRAYLDNRKQKGFHVIQAVAYWFPHGEDGPGPQNAPNAYGHRPFAGDEDEPDTARPLTVEGGSPDSPNDYWDHVDFVLREIRERGMYAAVLPCWGRAYVNEVMKGSRAVFNERSARAYGRFLGERYGREPHIVWVLGGDIDPTKVTPAERVSDLRPIYRAMAEEIGRAATGAHLRWNLPDPAWDRVFMTYHPMGDPPHSSSVFFYPGEPWLDANGIETWQHVHKVYQAVSNDYALYHPSTPTLFLEGAYETKSAQGPGAPQPDLRTRRQAWQAMLAGAAGHTYGANPMWHFQRKARGETPPDEWKRALDYPGAAQCARIMANILHAQQWWMLVPDQSLIAGGAGHRELLKTAARSADGKRILVYFPDATPARLNLPPGARVSAAWYRLTDGHKEVAAAVKLPDFTPPAGWPDALLVIEVQ